MVALTFFNALTGPDWARFGSIQTLFAYEDPVLSHHWLYSGAQAEGTITRARLTEGAEMANPEVVHVTGFAQTYRVTDFTILNDGGPTLWSAALDTGALVRFDIGREGRISDQQTLTLGNAIEASQIHRMEVDGIDLIVTGARDSAGLRIYQPQGDALNFRHEIKDHGKSATADTADLAHVSNASGSYLITGSTGDAGISSYRINSTGEAELIDTLGLKDGMWLSGLDSLTQVSAQGVDYVVVGAVNSSSLSLIRVNSMGVLFVEDHIFDTLDTRFQQVDAVTGFSISDRGFVVAGGADDGLSLFEILPAHQLFQHGIVVQSLDAALENISALTFTDFANEVQVIAAGQPGLSMARIDKTQVATPIIGTAAAETLTGGAQDDLIWGGAGADILNGGAGDDLLSGGAGLDRLTGGAGADVFIFDNDTARDEVLDFGLGADRLDIGAWGRIYDVSALSVGERNDGAVISYQDLSIRLYSANGQRIEAEEITNDLFLF